MPRYITPGHCPSLKEARYWSLDWVTENGIEGPFNYVVLLKSDSGYKVMGQYATASEAFDDRRHLVEETGTRSYFLRADRVHPIEDTVVVGPDHPESREDPGLIQSVSQTLLPGLRAWAEVGGIAPSQCSKAFLLQPIST